MKPRIWTDDEKLALVSTYPTSGDGSAKIAVYRLSRQLNRTHAAIRKKACQMGLMQRKGTRTSRHWEQSEIDLLMEKAGETPIPHLMRELKELWNKTLMEPRSRNAIALKINQLGLSRTVSATDGQWFTVASIAAGLRCKESLVRAWVKDKELNKILKAEPNGNQQAVFLIRRANLKRFFIAYPGVLDSTRPDMVWLVDVIAGKDYL